MTTIFLICAVLGGTTLVVLFLLALVGFGAHAFDLDVPGHFDGHHFDGHHFGGHLDADAHHADSTWLFGVISFRTIVAALTFFGLTGLAANSGGVAPIPTLAIASAAGLAAMFAVYGLMRWLMSLRAEGNVHIAGAVGRVGTVYTSIPADAAGAGKIQLNLQGRTMEYLAVTPGGPLKPGAKVIVSAVVSSDTLEVQSALETTEDDA